MANQTNLNDFNQGERKTYPQDWVSYNNAQTKEKQMFYNIVNELLDYIPTKEKPKTKGRPSLSERDMLFCSILKVYSMFSSRRSISDLKFLEKMRYIEKAPHFNSVCNYINNPSFEHYLKYLIQLSSLPLVQVEEKFAVDASGFSSANHDKWVNVRLDKKAYKDFKKAHVMSGVYTNIITSVEVTDSNKHDSPYFPQLVNETSANFGIKEVSADKAYISRDNLDVVSKVGGIPFIPFKKNSIHNSKGSNIWSTMFVYFKTQREEYMKHYHLRSNAESVFSMIKTKFGGYLKTRKDQAQINEVLLKCLCHNICVLISEIFTLGIDVDFNKCAKFMSAQK